MNMLHLCALHCLAFPTFTPKAPSMTQMASGKAVTTFYAGCGSVLIYVAGVCLLSVFAFTVVEVYKKYHCGGEDAFACFCIVRRYQWQWVVLLPFIDKARLLKVTRPLESRLSSEERFRNRLSETELFVHHSHPLSSLIEKLRAEDGRGLEPHEEPAWGEMKSGQLPRGVIGKGVAMLPAAAGGLNGQLFFDQHAVVLGHHLPSPVGRATVARILSYFNGHRFRVTSDAVNGAG